MKGKRVVVIGAGLGGLSAAAFLAKNGFQVDLFERHNTAGGYATRFVRNGYEFEASLHELSGIGPEHNRGSCYRLLEGCDVARRVEFLPIDNIVTLPGIDCVMPACTAGFAQQGLSTQLRVVIAYIVDGIVMAPARCRFQVGKHLPARARR